MGSKCRSLLLRSYPDLSDNTLPVIIGCLDEHDLDEVKQGFQRVCFKDVRIIGPEGVRSNHLPAWIWRLYYELKHSDTELREMKYISAPNLPNNDEALKNYLRILR
ncbi:hypothetical protein Zmor_011583 [Zophobas morio]|uniref:Uncharacterized protein n=1 Tax=Zophobas morio TaxID=2755281 RepID=A0AA38ITD9_9CUCU|nr:hypothetical protein Zmor_011583 [Zophobas morio]